MSVPASLDWRTLPLAATRFVREQMAQRLAAAGQSTFDRLIADVEERLTGAGGEALADPVHPAPAGDVAVLLDTNRRVQRMRVLLAERGAPLVGAGKTSALESPLADDLQLLLHALLHPGDMAARRARHPPARDWRGRADPSRAGACRLAGLP